jgi:hypothetical protein
MTPTVLRDTYEYRDESYVQSNCVKTYIEHKDTCIISLRDENDKRITNEFIPMGKSKKMVNVQSRTRFNGVALGTDLQPFIEQLNLKMKKACKEKIYGKTQVIKECKLTGKQHQVKKGRGRMEWLVDEVMDLPF